MERVIACMLSLSLSACMFVVPKDRRSVTSRTEQWQDPVQLGPVVASVQGRAHGTGVAVRATWRRTCEVRGDLVVEHRISRGAALKVWAGSGRDSAFVVFFGLVAAPFTLMVSGIATAVSVSGTEDRFETTTEPLPARRGPCDAPGAGLEVLVVAPGHDAVAVTTGADGTAYAELGDAAAAQRATVQFEPGPPR